MLHNLLNLPAGGQKVEIDVAALYALIGFLVVFAGIIFLVFVVWLVGKVMSESNNEKKESITQVIEQPVEAAPAISEDIDEETIAVIMAALTAYYEKNNPKCEFTLKRIKRI